ncbi:MAG TPA: hypothetical protein VGJ20_20165 [Xanthobacteraceae bacterium]
MPDDNRMSYTVMYSDDGRNFKELKNGWFYILTKDCDCPEAQVTVIPPDRREVKDGDKLPKNLDAVFPEVASEEQQKAPLITKLAMAWKKRAS